MMSCMPRAWVLVALSFLLAAGSARGQTPTPKAIDDLVRNALKTWEVPGAAVVIVRDGKVIYLKGFGVRTLGGSDAVTPDTVFALSSCTKAFTTTALAMLADEKKLDWDHPVRKHLPDFRLADPLADENVTLRDLLCHRTGIGTHEFLWYRAPWDLEEQIRRVGHVKPARSFRTSLIYQNILVGAAGLAVEKASGQSWASFVKERITGRLGMSKVSFTTAAALQAPDHAAAHRRNRDGKIEVVPWYDFGRPHPAMSLNASASDLGPWLKFQLGDGTWGQERLVSAENLAETHMPQVIIRHEGMAKKENPLTIQMSYALGWAVLDYRGHKLVTHAGNIDGMRAHITLAPAAGIGLAILSNLQDTRMNLALSNQLIDHLLGLPHYDWDGLYLKVLKEQYESAVARAAEREKNRTRGTKPSLPLEAYVGTYDEPAYGTATVALDQGRLVWRWSTFQCPLEHWHFDTFTLASELPFDPQMVFALGSNGAVATLRVLDVDFKKVKKPK
jgi:CubicO group peptidase (beta-lactamase class C family)